MAIIAINVFVFLFLQGPSFSLSGGTEVETRPVVEYGAIPYRIAHPSDECGLDTDTGQVLCEGSPSFDQAAQAGALDDITDTSPYVTLVTSMFMHGGWLHIVFNMLFLWIFGNNVEDSMGRPRFVLFYLLGGLAAAGAQVAVDPASTVPVVGASGAIAAVLGGYAVLYPRARVLTAVWAFFVFLFEIPAMVWLGLWIFMQFLPAVGQLATPDDLGGQGGVAYWAHIGGFLFGLVLIKLFANRRSRTYGSPGYPAY